MSLTAGQYTVATDGTHIATDGVKRYVALLTQSETDAPTAVVLENTLGFTPTFSYEDTSQYGVNSAAGFPVDKTIVLFTMGSGPSGAQWVSSSMLNLNTPGDNSLSKASIEIRVYP